MSSSTLSNKLLQPKNVLFFSLLIYLIIIILTYLPSHSPAGVDVATHLFQIWLFQNEGFTAWNHWWYAGNPQLDQYPPLSHWLPSLFSGFLGVELSYKLFFSAVFLLLPISFYYLLKELDFSTKNRAIRNLPFLKELDLSDDQKSIALLFFSFSSAFLHFFQGAVYSFMFSLPFLVMYLKFLLKFIKSNKIHYGVLSSLFLSFAFLTHLFSPVGMALLTFIYLLSYYCNLSNFKKFFAVLGLSAVMVSFFWVPLFLNYTIHTSSSSFSFVGVILKIIENIGRTTFSYFNLFSLTLLGLLGIILLRSFYQYYKKKENTPAYFFALILLVPTLISLTPYGTGFLTRTPLLYPIFFSLLIGNFYNLDKKINYAIYLLLFGMFLLFLMHPIYSVDNGLSSASEWASSLSDSRVLFLPQGFEFISKYDANPSPHEYLYSTYLMPVRGIEVYNGWFGEFAPHSEKDDTLMFYCTYPKPIKELMNTITIFGNTISTGMNECTIHSSGSEFCNELKEDAVDTVFVNELFPEVKTYVESAGCFEKLSSFGTLIAYKVLGHKPYVDYNFNYTKHSGKIEITLEGPLTDSITIRESYYPYWKAYLDEKEIPVNESPSQFLQVDLSIQEGQHTLLLVYSPPRYGNIFLYLSVFGWLLAIFVLLNPKYFKFVKL